MPIMCGELVKTARAVDVVNSIGFGHASPVLSTHLPRFLSAGASFLSSILLAWIFDGVMPSSHFGSAHACPLVIPAPVIRQSCCLVPLLTRFALSSRLPYRSASLRLSPRSSCRRAGRCHAASVCGLLALSVRCGIRPTTGRAFAYLVISAIRRCR